VQRRIDISAGQHHNRSIGRFDLARQYDSERGRASWLDD